MKKRHKAEEIIRIEILKVAAIRPRQLPVIISRCRRIIAGVRSTEQ
jgi:hypothetical protein